MSITLNTKTYSSFRLQADSNQFNGPAATGSLKDEFIFRRKFPVPTATFAGVTRPGIKFTRTLTLTDSSKVPMVLDISGSVPVGATNADILAVLADAAALLASQDAKDLFTLLDINA